MKSKHFLPLTALLLLTACTPAGEVQVDATATPVVSEATRTVPDWGVQVYTTSFTAEGHNAPVFSPEYRLPKIKNAEGIPAYEAINAYYAEILDSLAIAASETAGWALEDLNITKATGDPFYPYIDTEQYAVAMESRDRVSILRTHTNATGSPATLTYPTGETFDLTTGERLYFADLISVSEETAQESVLAAVCRLNAANGYSGTVLPEEELRESYHPEQFYLTEDSFVVYYPAGTLTGITNSPTFAIPYSDLEEILTPWE